MCYKTNFLTKVIVRADFASHDLGQLDNHDSFAASIASDFPHVEKGQLVKMAFTMGLGNSGANKQETAPQFTYKRKIDGTVSLVLGPTFMVLEYGPADYSSFEEFFACFSKVFSALKESFSVPQVDRIGLRYINEIRLPGRATDWEGIISADLISSVRSANMSDSRLLRSMHQVIQRVGDCQITCNYGIVNLDFPAPAVERHFILDIDCNRDGLLESADALTSVKKLNDLATQMFESSIDNGLRDKMEIVQ
jgi:uncharacterized protein (TIGR04255 family)